MKKDATNEYGVPTKEFQAALSPHEANIDKAVNDLMGQGWSDAEIFKALSDSLSTSMSSRRLVRAMEMRKAKQAAG